MEGHSTPVEAQLRTEGRDGQHQQQCQEVNGIDFRQAIPDKPLVAGCGDAIPEHVRVVVSQDESAEDEEERYAAFGRIEKQTAAGQRSIRGDYISHATVVRATRTVQVKVVEQRSLLAGSNRPLVGAASRIPDRKAKSTGKTVAFPVRMWPKSVTAPVWIGKGFPSGLRSLYFVLCNM